MQEEEAALALIHVCCYSWTQCTGWRYLVVGKNLRPRGPCGGSQLFQGRAAQPRA